MSSLSASQLNSLAKKLKSLHISGQPLLLANVWDASSAKAISSLSSTKAIATASYAVAMMVGTEDADLTVDDNLLGVKFAAAGLRAAGKAESIPLSADLQDGYDDPAETVRKAIELGVVGANIEDAYTDKGAEGGFSLRSIEESVARIKSILTAAKKAGVPEFVINARTDSFGKSDNVEDAIQRGKAYLDAGATTVFVWGVGKHAVTVDEVKKMVMAFDGRLAVQPGDPGIPKLRELGVSRISIGPTLWVKAMSRIGADAVEVQEA